MLHNYFHNTTSDNRYQKYEIEEAYELNKELDNQRYRDLGNKKLLWHGSRLTNYVGIISQGLRIAPPEAPSTGYLFGKGVYFADMASKSVCYCYPSNNIALILLCEVSLGSMNMLKSTDYNAKENLGSNHSTKGCGRTIPSEEIDFNGVKVPIGKPKQASEVFYFFIFLVQLRIQ